jgi:hypothetical protein
VEEQQGEEQEQEGVESEESMFNRTEDGTVEELLRCRGVRIEADVDDF